MLFADYLMSTSIVFSVNFLIIPEKTIKSLKTEDLERMVYIRKNKHTVTEALNKQLTHYSYHIGQMVFLGKLLKGKDWEPLIVY